MYKNLFIIAVLSALSVHCFADCSYDHLLIGCNQDGIAGTADDDMLFIDCTKKYRHSDPNNPGIATWLNWRYPLYYSPPPYDRYGIGEPGFDVIGTSDPNRQLIGIANVDYRIIIECVSITPGFSARKSTLGILFDQPGDMINHSALSNKHIDLEYRAPSPAGATDLQWITYRLYDGLGKYLPSEPFSVVFVKNPLAGDLVIDDVVDIYDLAEFCYYWLRGNSDKSNDYYERADINKDGEVNFIDFTLMSYQ